MTLGRLCFQVRRLADAAGGQKGSPTLLEQFHFEIALLARKRQPPYSGVDSGENRVFSGMTTLKFIKF